MPTTLESMFEAILADDRPRVKELLKADREIVNCRVDQPVLYQCEIFHWIYAGDVPLHLAAAGYRVEIVRSLLGAGADPNAAANHRRSAPIHYAADGYINGPAWNATSQVSTLRCLIEAGAAVNAPDKNGATPLHRAVRTRCAEAVEYLLQAGADPMARNKSGSIPFHLAVQTTGRGGSGAEEAKAAQRQIILAFLAIGMSTGLKDGQGKSVLDCAKSAAVRAMLSSGSLPAGEP